MTGVELGLVILLANVIGVVGGKMWGIKSVENKFLPRVEHELSCNNVQLKTSAEIKDMKEDIIEAIKANGNCSACKENPSHSPQ